MSILQAIILGIIQGLTEFLPVSSSGHLELCKALFDMDFEGGQSKLVTVVLHGATALSTIVVFRKDIADLLKGLLKFEWNWQTKYMAMLLLSMLPAGAVYALFKSEIDSLFDGQVVLVGAMLLLTAALLYITHRFGSRDKEVTDKKALVVGISQAIAILPGVSRSGATIATSLLLGINKEQAARFSFLMVIPVIFGAMLLDTMEFIEHGGSELNVMALSAGFVTAFIVGVLACRWMIAIVKKSKLSYFAIYCAIVGTVAIIAGLVG